MSPGDILDWAEDSLLRILLVLLVPAAAILFLVWFFVSQYQERHPCLAYSQPVPVTTYIKVGDVLVPIVNMEKVCLERAK